MFKNESGSVSILGAFMIILALGIGAFAIDLANLHRAKLVLQRVTDAAAFSGASRPDAAKNGMVSSEAEATVASVLRLNDVDPSTMLVELEDGEANTQNLVVSANQAVPLLFGKLLSESAHYDVGARSYVRVSGEASQLAECLQSLTGPINIYGSAQVIGPDCLATSSSYLHLCGTAKLEVDQVSVRHSASEQRPYICNGTSLEPPLASFRHGEPSVDALAGDERIRAIRSRLDRMRSPGWPYGSSSPGTPIKRSAPTGFQDVHYVNSFSAPPLSSSVPYRNLFLDTSTIRFAGLEKDSTCQKPTTFSGPVELRGRTTIHLAAGCYVFGSSFTIASNAQVEFVTEQVSVERSTTPSVTLVFNGSIKNSGKIIFGDATVSIGGSIDNRSGTVLQFGKGDFILAGGSILNGAGLLEKGNGIFYANGGTLSNGVGTMAFGNGTFYLWGGSFANASTGTVRFGDGPFIFYGGTLTNVSGVMTFGRGPFEFHGGSLTLNRYSQTTFGVGDMNFYGGSVSFGGKKVVFGAGGDVDRGGSSIFLSGGTLSLPASSIEAVGTTIAFDGGTISMHGNGDINVLAPMGEQPEFGYRDVLFVVYGGAFNLYEGTGRPNRMSGLIYAPRTQASIYGRQVVERPENGCLHLVAGVVDIYQGAKLDLAACTERRGGEMPAKPVLVR